MTESSSFYPVQSNRICALGSSSGVLEEAEFYNIASLVRLVKERIRDNENRTSQVMHPWVMESVLCLRRTDMAAALAVALLWFSSNRGINAVGWMQGMASKESSVWLYKAQTTESSQPCRERQRTLTGEGPGADMGGYKGKHTALAKSTSNSSFSKPFLPFVPVTFPIDAQLISAHAVD